METLPLLAFGFGPLELAVIAGVALLLFGHRLPSVMRGLGRGLSEFRAGLHGVECEIEEAAR